MNQTEQLPFNLTTPHIDEAEAEAGREFNRTGRVPMSYVQGILRQGFSSGDSIMEAIRVSLGMSAVEVESPSSNRGER